MQKENININNYPEVTRTIYALEGYAIQNNMRIKFYSRVSNTGEFAIYVFEGDELGHSVCFGAEYKDFLDCVKEVYNWIDNNKNK